MKVITMPRLNRALRTAITDFEACGLYTDALAALPVRLTWAHYAYGLCWQSGEIDIPALSLSRLGELFGRPPCALTDIVRHEMAHALAHVHLDAVDTREFATVFGGAYWAAWDEAPDFDPELFVSPYAATAPAEDFAETVMVYTRRRGRVDRYRAHPGLARAFDFVTRLADRLSRPTDPMEAR